MTGEVRVSPTITDYHLTLLGNFSASPPVLPGLPPPFPSYTQEHSHNIKASWEGNAGDGEVLGDGEVNQVCCWPNILPKYLLNIGIQHENS